MLLWMNSASVVVEMELGVEESTLGRGSEQVG